MAISRVGSASAEANTVTIPAGHIAGDFIAIYAFRDGSATFPTLPAGWTKIEDTAGTTCSDMSGWKIATSAAETSGTWTNATEIICIVYRGVDQTTPVGGAANNAGVGTTVNYQPLFSGHPKSKKTWVLGFAGHRSINTALETPPTNLTLVKSQVGATAEAVAHDSDGGIGTWASTDVAVGGSSSGWTSTTVALLAATLTINNYLHASASDGNTGIISVTEKTR